MVDTFVVNLSAAAEEVAAMFKTRIVPISAGTPQELAFAESAVRVMKGHGRYYWAHLTYQISCGDCRIFMLQIFMTCCHSLIVRTKARIHLDMEGNQISITYI